MNRIAKTGIATAAIAITMAAAPASADEYWQFSLGADYSSGDYGDVEDTTMLAIPVGVKFQGDNVWFRASVPYVRVDGPDGVIPGEGGVSPGNGNGNGGGGSGEDIVDTNVRSGVGDVNLAAGYTLPVGDRTWFDLIGKVKLPTASKSKFLGTGTTDYTLMGELLHSFGGVSVAVNGGRRFNGSNDLYPLNDVWQAGGGIYGKAGEQLTLGLGYEWREGALDTSPNRSEVTGSATYKVSPGLLLQGYGYTGLSDGSPDVGAGLQVLVRMRAD
ncbi:hypothetical protein [Croceicoccus naphthovorans]|uniref:Uncharacterized protein n=1 Tax=Croceicoccus naphthovorans TaxID=1348774 RepID=A0A0G3XIN8_9SPHN|nr:hypothetical protein [Croceicoccus naphthovorans]AKM10484.1 hypothetical protein AB433_11740 [Croceicoccus naphthovorans]MBB3988660.1 hypothetical protein [Croceicoccus naphthovorans]